MELPANGGHETIMARAPAGVLPALRHAVLRLNCRTGRGHLMPRIEDHIVVNLPFLLPTPA